MRQRRSRFVPALLLAVVTAVGLPPGSAAAQEEEDGQLVVGRSRLEPCQDLEGAWCGNLRVPFDREDPDAGTVPISSATESPEAASSAPLRTIRGGPAGGEAQMIGNPGAVGYDRKRQHSILKALTTAKQRRNLKKSFEQDLALMVSYRGKVADHIQRLVISVIKEMDNL